MMMMVLLELSGSSVFLILGPEERLEPGIDGLCLSESSGLVGGVGRSRQKCRSDAYTLLHVFIIYAAD